MRINDALENEKNRQESESWNKIYLHKDGKFFHAYEWSACCGCTICSSWSWEGISWPTQSNVLLTFVSYT